MTSMCSATRLTKHGVLVMAGTGDYAPSPEDVVHFLVQELGREFNTVTSKSQSAEVARTVVEAKAELEKIREQVQNIE